MLEARLAMTSRGSGDTSSGAAALSTQPGSAHALARALASGAGGAVGLAACAALLEWPLDWQDLARSGRLTGHAAAVTAVAWAFMSIDARRHGRFLQRAAVVAAVATLVSAAFALFEVGLEPRVLAVALAVGLLGGAFAAALAGLRRIVGPAGAGTISLALAALACAAPLWLGPLVEQWADRRAVADAVLALSPLTYLAIAADFDYLRGAWFYRFSPFGALRYDYASFAAASVFYGMWPAMAALFVARDRLRRFFLRSANPKSFSSKEPSP
jgi:hypothetical protein